MIEGASVWLAAHAMLLVVNLLVFLARAIPPPPASQALRYWLRWDAGNYINIAEHGYGTSAWDTAFFPFYPIMIRAFDTVLPGDAFVAAFTVSNAAGLLTLVFLHRLVTREVDREVAGRTIFFLVAFPTGFFLSAPYNESLYLALVIPALYLMRRGNWWAVGALGAVASATRLSGLLLGVPMVFEYLRQRRFRIRAIRWDALSIGLVPLGTLAFATYCQIHLGDALAFANAQTLWGRGTAGPWTSIILAANQLGLYSLLQPNMIYNIVDLGAVLAAAALLVLCLVGPWRMRVDQLHLVGFGILTLLLILCSPIQGPRPLQSAARYVIEIFPAFIILAKIGKNRHLERLYLLPAVAIQVIWVVLFLQYEYSD